jgi:DNA-binding HxlR family transcriptional regulator
MDAGGAVALDRPAARRAEPAPRPLIGPGAETGVPAARGSPDFGSGGQRRREVDWQSLRDRLAPLRTRWDLAILVNLAESHGPVRPADLIKAINTQSSDGLISWKVLEARMRRLEAAGYVAREEVLHVPRETRYWLLRRGRSLLDTVALLDDWYNEQDLP